MQHPHVSIKAFTLIECWSERRDSNSQHSPWQGDALPLSHFRLNEILYFNLLNNVKFSLYMVQMKGVEPIHPKALDPKSSASANSATSAYIMVAHPGIEPGTP